MENNLPIEETTVTTNAQELIIRFVDLCKTIAQNGGSQITPLCTADIVTAVYYYRKHPNVNDFLTKYLNYSQDYFQIQWIRSMWATFKNMSDVELSDLVINQIILVDNS